MRDIKKQFTFLLIAVIGFTFISCENGVFGIKGEGSVVTQELSFNELTGISSSISANIHLTQSDTQFISISAQQNILDNLQMPVNNGVVEFKHDRNVKKHDQITIYMSVKTLNEVKISGTGDVRTTNKFSSDETLFIGLSGSGNFDITADASEIYANMSGSGDMTINTNAQYLEANLSGSGSYNLSGSADIADYGLSGSGTYLAFGLQTKETNIDISGSGDFEVNASEKLMIKLSGSGNISYKGQPGIDFDQSGSGNLINAN